MICRIDQTYRCGFPVTGITLLVRKTDALNMVRIAGHLTHNVYSPIDRPVVAFYAVSRKTEGRMPRYRLVHVACVANKTRGMAVGKLMVMTLSANLACIMTIAIVVVIVLRRNGIAPRTACVLT